MPRHSQAPTAPDLTLQALREVAGGGVARGRADLGGRSLRWVQSGSGTPPVIMLAGYNDTALSWGPVLAALGGRAHVVAYDRAGLGDSDPDQEIQSAERSVADLTALIHQIGGGPFVVVAHSWGGLLALVLTARHPELVAGLVLVDPAHPDMYGHPPWLVRRAYGAAYPALPVLLQATGLARPRARRIATAAARSFSEDPRVQALVRAYVAQTTWPRARAALREGRGIAASEPAIRAALATPPPPRLPTVVFSATEGFSPMRRRWTAAQAALAADRGARHIVVQGSDHAVHLHNPTLIATAILDTVSAARHP